MGTYIITWLVIAGIVMATAWLAHIKEQPKPEKRHAVHYDGYGRKGLLESLWDGLITSLLWCLALLVALTVLRLLWKLVLFAFS